MTGKHAPSDREAELRIEKLFLRRNLAAKLDSGHLLGLDEFVSFLWHSHPNYVSEITADFLRELIAAHKEGRAYTEADWVKFCKQIESSKSSRDIVLYKLLYLGLIEKRNKTKMRYEIRLSDKFLGFLEYLTQSWVQICEK